MTISELANKLDGIEYPVRIPKEIAKEAKDHGWLIVYGASDDLIEFEGAFRDEAGVYNGGEVRFDKKGIIPPFDEVEHEPVSCREWIERIDNSTVIEALWCEEEGYSWTYKLDKIHYTFEVMEDGEHYCRGIVFAI